MYVNYQDYFMPRTLIASHETFTVIVSHFQIHHSLRLNVIVTGQFFVVLIA